MLTEQKLDQFLEDFFSEESSSKAVLEKAKDISKRNTVFKKRTSPEDELKEYVLPSDGMIIQQLEQKGKSVPAPGLLWGSC